MIEIAVRLLSFIQQLFFALCVTFSIASSWHQIVQTAVIARNFTLLSSFVRRYQVPNEVLYLFIALITLQTVKKL